MLAGKRIVETSLSTSGQAPAPPERRRGERVVTILRVGTLIVDGERELCLIRNMSAGGMHAHVYSDLEPGQKVTVELRSHQQIDGTIIWVRDENAGIEFDAPVDITAMLATPAVLENGWRPRMPRVEVDRLATLRAGAKTYWVQIRDISQGGVKIECEPAIEVGSPVVLTPEYFGPVSGMVRWQKDGACGIAFNQPIPFDQLIRWLKRES
jgi:hypothetical protein